MGDAFLKNLIGGEPDCVFVALRLQELVDLRVREGGIGANEAAHLAVPVTRDHGQGTLYGCLNAPSGCDHIQPSSCSARQS